MMESLNLDVHKVTDLIASKFISEESPLSVLKLHKLLYYVEAWHVALYGKMLFDEDFQAWVHGPVCLPVFTRFRHSRNKFTFSAITREDIGTVLKADIENYDYISDHVENVLEAYGDLSGAQLESLAHKEQPWLETRGDLAPSEPCNKTIPKELMRDYYKQRASGPE